MRKSVFFILTLMTLNSPALADTLKKSDLLAAIKEYGQASGMLDACMAWAANVRDPRLPDNIEGALFDKDINTNDIEYFQKAYEGAYNETLEEVLTFIQLGNGKLCVETLTPGKIAEGQVNADENLLKIIDAYKK
jgi:hypothetical protein